MQHSFSENFSYLAGTERVGTGCVSIIFPNSAYTSAQALQRGIVLANYVKACGTAALVIGDDSKIHFNTLTHTTATGSADGIHTLFICKRIDLSEQSEPKYIQFEMVSAVNISQADYASAFNNLINTITQENTASSDYIIVSAVITE